MKAFTIDTDNNITVHASRTAARETGEGVFDSEESLGELIGPDNKRLVAIFNSLTGVAPVKRFKDGATAAKRIFAELQKLGEPEDAANSAPVGEPGKRAPKAKAKTAKATKAPKPAKKVKAKKPAAKKAQAGSGPRESSKTAQLIEMLKRAGGATLEEVMAKFDWQAHTTRALMSAGGSLTKKHGITVISEKVGDSRTYRIK